jgi:hypothetical protein
MRGWAAAVGQSVLLIGLALAGCQGGDTSGRDCANDPVVVERSQETPLGFTAERALAAVTRSWEAQATRFDQQRQPSDATTLLQIAITPGEGPTRYQDPKVFENSRYERGRSCLEALHVPVALTITSADGRIALAEAAEIPVHRLDAVVVTLRWMLPSSREPGLLRYPPLQGRIDVPPEFVEQDTASALEVGINVSSGAGGMTVVGARRFKDALSFGPGRPLVSW